MKIDESLFQSTANERKRAKNKEKEDEERSTAILAEPGQTDKELNPFWKNGGTGMPSEEKKPKAQKMDVDWLKKSLQRAKEFAEQEGKSLEEVARERWGVRDQFAVYA